MKLDSASVGIMGSAGEVPQASQQSSALVDALLKRHVVLLTGATTGLIHTIGKAAHDAGIFHIGISPAHSAKEHVEQYGLPTDACDVILYTGFGLKGRNVVLVRSCDIVLIVSGAMGSLNEFTIAHDEGKVIGCLSGTGGVADEADYLLEKFGKKTGARIFQDSDPERLLELCWAAVNPCSWQGAQ